jgi:hypothetical protein
MAELELLNDGRFGAERLHPPRIHQNERRFNEALSNLDEVASSASVPPIVVTSL